MKNQEFENLVKLVKKIQKQKNIDIRLKTVLKRLIYLIEVEMKRILVKCSKCGYKTKTISKGKWINCYNCGGKFKRI